MSALFRSIEGDLGTHGFCILVLESFLNAICQYKIKDKKELFQQFSDIFNLIESVKPKYAILIDSFYKIFTEADAQSIQEIEANIKVIKASYQKEMQDLMKVSEGIDVDKKNILIYDHSHSVQNALKHLHKKGQRFTVLLAEQDLSKTEDNISFLHKLGVPFKVVPAYMISHLEETIDMAFFGGVTYQEGNLFVMDPGSKSMISELRIEKKPIYLYMTTSKFSLWPVKDSQKEIHVKSQTMTHKALHQIAFERIKFSHDRVSSSLIDFIVTEKGIYNSGELEEEFQELKHKRELDKKRMTFKGIF